MDAGRPGKRNAKRSSIPYLDCVCGLMWVGLPGSECPDWLVEHPVKSLLDVEKDSSSGSASLKSSSDFQMMAITRSLIFREVILESRSENISFLIIAVSNAGRTSKGKEY
ncbi:hypothetical protein TNCV_4779511 [Trichonephila clavipes]|nr:hypothetical protein TNCV_4779511 [Trichonephila clavipes]